MLEVLMEGLGELCLAVVEGMFEAVVEGVAEDIGSPWDSQPVKTPPRSEDDTGNNL